MSERETTVLNRENSVLWQDLIKISSSPRGRPPMAIIALSNDTGEVGSGQGSVPYGFGHFILKYEDVFTVIRWLNLPYKNIRQQYLRMVFNVIAWNVDDHSKNFSFCMMPDGVWSLSPAYDITYSVDQTALAYQNRHSLTINGKNEGIIRQDLEVLGKNNDVRDYNSLIDSVVDTVGNFERYSKDLSIDKGLIRRIKADFNT